ncbi:MAG: Glutamate 5-kinase [Petrotoga mobilis]|nr:MAG: Glutamate 5-kinase [Petrotoga mobilis]
MIFLKNTFNKIVIKVGSSSIADENGINVGRMNKIVEQVAVLKIKRRKDIIIVSSGAIAAGKSELGYHYKPYSLSEKQACAAVGQGVLISKYRELFAVKKIKVAQILLTAEDFSNRHRYLNAYNTMTALLENDVIPIVNENDTVTTDEIKFGDNDVLSAQVASLLEADLSIILSDIPGLLKDLTNPKSLINIVEEVTPELEILANGKSGKLGTGGMSSKLKAAQISIASGIPLTILPSYEDGIITKAVDNIEHSQFNIGTTFLPKGKKMSKRKRWIQFSLKPKGELIVDNGAHEALLKGKSLLAVGIISLSGNFSIGDLVVVSNKKGENIGKGLVNYSSEELKEIIGKKSHEILSFKENVGPEEVIHRDNLVTMEATEGFEPSNSGFADRRL